MTHMIMTEEIIKIGTDQIVMTGEISIDKVKVHQGMNRITGEKNVRLSRF